MSEQSALIVGPGSAFGFELASQLHLDGYTLGILGSNPDRLDAFSRRLVHAGISHYPAVTDARSEAHLSHVIAECADMLPPWRLAIYNVKYSPPGDAFSLHSHDFKESFEANVGGVLKLGRLLVNEWQRTESATYILSGGGYKDKPDPNKLALGVAKGALHTLAAAMRPTYAAKGISVKEVIIDGRVDYENGISPTLVGKRYVALTKSKRDTIVIDEKSR